MNFCCTFSHLKGDHFNVTADQAVVVTELSSAVLFHENLLLEKVSAAQKKVLGIIVEHSFKAANNVHDGTEDESVQKNTNINNCIENEFRGVGI